jgi:chitodextrinase
MLKYIDKLELMNVVLRLITLLLVFLLMVPVQAVSANQVDVQNGNITGLDWDVTFLPYKNNNGTELPDILGDQGKSTPAMFDITSGGSSSAFFYAKKNDNVYFRMSLKDDPRNSFTGGFNNQFRAMIQLLNDSGKIVGAVGLNGADPTTDYVYVASFNEQTKETEVQRLYEFPFSPENSQDSVRVVPNPSAGTYFLDIQLPIYDIEAATGLNFETDQVKLVYGTSMRGNLVEITKDSIVNVGASHSSLSSIALSDNKLKLETNITQILKGSNPPVVDEFQEYVIQYKVTNYGANHLNAVEVNDLLNSEVEVITQTEADLNIAESEIVWAVGKLDSLASKVKTLQVKFTPTSSSEGQPFVISDRAYVTSDEPGSSSIDSVNAAVTKNVMWERLINIGSDSSTLDDVVVSSASPVIRGVSNAENGEKVTITVTSGVTTRTYFAAVADGFWTLDMKKENAPLLENGKTYTINASIGGVSDEQTLRYVAGSSEYSLQLNNNLPGISSDNSIITNESVYTVVGTTSAPIGSLLTFSTSEIVEVIENPNSLTMNMWQLEIDLSSYQDGTYMFDAYLEGKSESPDTGMANNVYTNFLVKLDMQSPTINVNDEEYLNIPSAKPLITGLVSEPDTLIELLLDLDGDGTYTGVSPDVKYVGVVKNDSWQVQVNDSLPRGMYTSAMLLSTDKAGNVGDYYFSIQPTSDELYLNVELPSTNTFVTNDILISGATNAEPGELVVLKVTDTATNEMFNYYSVVSNDQTIDFQTLDYNNAGDYLKNGDYSYRMQFIHPKFSDLTKIGTFKVDIPKPIIVINNYVPKITLQNNVIMVDGLIVVDDLELFYDSVMKLTLTNSSNAAIKHEFQTKIDEAGNFVFEEDVEITSGIYKITLDLTDRAFNNYLHAPTNTNIDVDIIEPTVPTGVLSQTTTNNSATFRWNASTDNRGIKEYEIWVDGLFKKLASSLSDTLTNLTEFTSYDIQVVAVDNSGNRSQKSDILKIKTLDKTAPTIPSSLKQSNVTETKFSVTWEPSTDIAGSGISSYEVYLNGKLMPASGTTPSFTFTALKPETTYSVTLKAKDVSGNISGLSQAFTVITSKDMTAPTKPGTLKATDVRTDRIKISWDASTDNVTMSGYEVYLDNKLFMNTKNLNTNLEIAGLKINTIYKVKVRSYDATGNKSEYSNELSVKTVDNVKPSTPSGVKVTDVDMKTVRVSWLAAKDESGIANYEVFADGVRVATTSKLTFDLKTPSKSVVKYQVIAIDKYNNKSALSTAVNYNRKPTLEVRGKLIFVNGAPLKMPSNVGPVLRNGTMMIPYKQVFDALALTSSYNSKTKVITASKTGYKLTLTIGNKSYRSNNTVKSMTVAPVQINSTIMLPNKFYEQEFGMRYAYSAK